MNTSFNSNHKDKFYDDYFQSFYIKQFNYWHEVFQRTQNKDAERRMNELKELVYKKWFIILETEETQKKVQLELF